VYKRQSEALRDDVSRSVKPKLGEAGFLEGFDPELARLIAAPEAGSVKVNPRVAAKQKAENEKLEALNVLEEMGSARYEIQRGDTLSGIAQDHGTTVEALALANKISNPDMIYAGETLEMAADGGMMPYGMDQGRTVPYQEDFSLSPIAPDKVRLLRAQGYSDEQILQMIREENLNRGTVTGQELYGVGEEADIFRGRTSYPLVPESVTEGVKDVLEGSDIAKYGFGYQRNEGGRQGLMGVPMGAAEDLSDFSEMARQSQIARDPIGSSKILSLIDRGMEVPRRGFEQLIEGVNLARPYINTESPYESLPPGEVGRRGEEVLRNINIPLTPAGEEVVQGAKDAWRWVNTPLISASDRSSIADAVSGAYGELVDRSIPGELGMGDARQDLLARGERGVGSLFNSLIDSVSGAFREDASNVTDEQRVDSEIVKTEDTPNTKGGDASADLQAQLEAQAQGQVQGQTGDADNILKNAAINVGTPDQTGPHTDTLAKALFGRSYKPMDDGALALINLGAGIAKGDITGGMQSAVTAMGEERDRRRKEELSSAQAEYYLSAGDRTSKKTRYDMMRAATARVKDMSLVDRKDLLSRVLGKEVSMAEAGTPDMMEKLIDIIARQYAAQTLIPASTMAGLSPDQAGDGATPKDPLQAARDAQMLTSIGRSLR
jgi:LysM repeat protein